MSANFQRNILLELMLLFDPIAEASRKEDARRDVLAAVGWLLDKLPHNPGSIGEQLDTAFQAFGAGTDALDNLLDNPPDSLEDLFATLDRIRQLFDALRKLSSLSGTGELLELGPIGVELIQALVLNYLQRWTPIFYYMLTLLTIITLPEDTPPTPEVRDSTGTVVRESYQLGKLNLERINELFTNPAGTLRDEYFPGGLPAADKLLPRLGEMLKWLGASTRYDAGTHTLLVMLPPPPNADIVPPSLTLAFSTTEDGGGLVITPAPVPFKFTQPVGSWDVDLALDASGRFVLNKHGATASGTPVTGHLTLTKSSEASSEPVVRVGSYSGSRLEVGRFSTTGDFSTEAAHPHYGLLAEASSAKLVLSSGDGDSFLQQVLPPDGLQVDFDLGLGWSTQNGFYLKGSAALEAVFDVHVSLGPVLVEDIHLGIGLGQQDSQSSGLLLELSTTVSANIGPVTVSIDRVGLAATIQFKDGNLGPIDLGFGFKPPGGVGLSVDADVVKGGGFLYLDTDRGDYVGELELVFADFLNLHAIGLITTKMPNGSSGFSLLIIITADFGTGIELGFGFTLLAVGGLLGLNRAMLLQPLMNGVRTGSINSIMFPQNVVANASRIISDLRAIFPAQEGTFLIGPMAKLGWGEPTLVSIALGIIIEIPGDIAILGVLKLALPTASAAVIVLQVNFFGAIEFSKQRLYFFATLFDSRVLFITIEGEMGVLVAFGDNANFVISVGGFHPRYNPPPLPFPRPRRIEVDIINESYARIRCEGYFAVTSDTVQFGARAEFFFGFDVLSVEGHAGFDALLQFSPFHFSVSISTSFSVKVFGLGVFGIDIDLTLEGPTPWHACGTASLDFFFFSIGIGIDFTWGDSRDTSLPPIAVMPILAAELAKQSNWRAILPTGSHLLVSLRQLDPEESDFVLHPVGTLHISQRAIPLDLTLDKVGNQKPSDANRFALTVASAELNKIRDLQEPFAPAQFKNFDDAAKLSLPAYVLQHSGMELAAGANLASGTAISRIVRYNLTVIDTKYRQYLMRFFVLVGSLFFHFLGGASVTRSPLSAYRAAQIQPFTEKVTVRPETFAVALRSNNTIYRAEAASFTSQVAARDYLERAVANDPSLAGTLHVLPQFEVAL